MSEREREPPSPVLNVGKLRHSEGDCQGEAYVSLELEFPTPPHFPLSVSLSGPKGGDVSPCLIQVFLEELLRAARHCPQRSAPCPPTSWVAGKGKPVVMIPLF